MDQVELTALALTSRLVDADVRPLSAAEFWKLTDRVGPEDLPSQTPASLEAHYGVPRNIGDRVMTLLARAGSLAFALEELEHQGVQTITALSDGFPRHFTEALTNATPVALHGVGQRANLTDYGKGIGVVGVLADSLSRTVSRPSMRGAVASGHVTLVTPYKPSAPFSAGNAMGRNKIIYGLSKVTVVVQSDNASGGTWAGATEALTKGFGSVASWSRADPDSGNNALVKRGAHEIHDTNQLIELYKAPSDAQVPPAVNQPKLQLRL